MKYQAIIRVEFTDEDVAAGCGDPLGEANEIIVTLMGALNCNMWLDEVVEIEEEA